MSTSAAVVTSPSIASPSGITARSDRSIRGFSTGATVIVALAAAVLSWSGLTRLAIESGITPSIAWLLPITVDGSMLSGSLAVLHATLRSDRAWFGWVITAAGAGLSVWGNVSASAVSGYTASIVHGIAPLALLASLELLFRLVRHRLSAEIARAQAAEAAAVRAAADEGRRAEAAAKAEARAAGREIAELAKPKAQRGSSRVRAIERIMATLPTDGMTTRETLIVLLSRIDGLTSTDVVQSGILDHAGDTPEQNKARVFREFSRAKKDLAGVSASAPAALRAV